MRKRVAMTALLLAALCLTGCGSSGNSANEAPSQHEMVGTTVTMGSVTKGKETTPIEWAVLDVKDGNALLLSRSSVSRKPYHQRGGSVTWEECSLRSWLNGDFLDKSFSETERKHILLTDVDNSGAQKFKDWKADGGKNTQDYIFLLSDHQAFDVYFSSDEARICAKQGEADSKGEMWWLRSPGQNQAFAAYVTSSGSRGSNSTDFVIPVVRPAMWVSLACWTN